MNWEEFDREKRKAYSAPKGFRVMPIIAPDGKRWKWINRGRYWAQVSLAEPEPFPLYKNSSTMATNRNKRRKSFGYTDTYSMRERGWPYALHRGKPY